ncbi:adenosylcobinamide-GDP ribazoletransferase [Marivita sp. S6314]|uniref:adenosylcobinamide-GDP ribazoletransferase n=1 Tax=Marivita sp. S6314 TaxID=2926406 RepID=UPI001FF23C20|nr:adenosylcobinamide-GDP ribazoletransferase [Marivita sp. S6314]MCK0150932.1 adenosylcobinamide-GDP ribazoletransferase [Marivita sp. S6314]
MTSRAQDEWHVFLTAVQFLTRLPVPKDLPFSEDLMLRATRYYPLVGGVIGVIGAAVLWAASLALPMAVAVLLSMAATIFATGAFHEDGMADAADGLGGGMTRDRALEIMRDSRIGTYGTVALGMVLALKATVLTSLAVSDAVVAVILAHIVSRAATVQIVSMDSYAREVGAKFVTPTVVPGAYRFAMLTGALTLLVGAVWFGIGAMLVAVAVAGVAAGVFRAMMLRKVQGYTGDCLGAIQQLSELGLYLGLALWL